MITTDTEGLTAGEVQIPTRDRQIPAYRAMPAGKTGLATVLVVQEIFGVHEHIKDVTRRLAKQGYLAVAPELYVRQGDPTKYTDTGALINDIVAKVPDAQVMADLDETAAWAVRNGGGASWVSPDFAGAEESFTCTPRTIQISLRPSRGMGRLRVRTAPATKHRCRSPIVSRHRCLGSMAAPIAAYQMTPSSRWEPH